MAQGADCYTVMCKAVDRIVASFKKNSVIGTPECISIYKSKKRNTLQCTEVRLQRSGGQFAVFCLISSPGVFRGRLGQGHIVG